MRDFPPGNVIFWTQAQKNEYLSKRITEGHLSNKEPHKTAIRVLSQQVSQSAQEKNCFQVTTSSNIYVETYMFTRGNVTLSAM